MLSLPPCQVKEHKPDDPPVVSNSNKQFASWLGLTLEAARKYIPDLDKTHKGHSRKTLSGLRSTKTKPIPLLDNSDHAFDFNQQDQLPLHPNKKEKTIFFCVLDMEDKAMQKIWTDQTGRLPKEFSKGNQYIMVLTESNSDASSLLKQ